MPKKPIIIILVLCVIALALGYWSGQDEQEVTSGSDVKSSENKEPEFLRDGLVAYYPFNGNADDESGNGNDGTLSGIVNFVPDRFAVDSSSIEIEKLPSGIIIPSSPKLEELDPSEHTVTYWIKAPSGLPQKTKYVFNRNAGRNQQWFYIFDTFESGNELYGAVRAGSGPGISDLPATGRLELGTWHQVTFSTNSDVTVIFVDGIVQGQYDRLVWNNSLSGIDFILGYTRDEHGSNNQFVGLLDDLRIYDRALSAEEVKALYEFEKAS